MTITVYCFAGLAYEHSERPVPGHEPFELALHGGREELLALLVSLTAKPATPAAPVDESGQGSGFEISAPSAPWYIRDTADGEFVVKNDHTIGFDYVKEPLRATVFANKKTAHNMIKRLAADDATARRWVATQEYRGWREILTGKPA